MRLDTMQSELLAMRKRQDAMEQKYGDSETIRRGQSGNPGKLKVMKVDEGCFLAICARSGYFIDVYQYQGSLTKKVQGNNVICIDL